MALPKWLQNSEQKISTHQKESGQMLNKATVKVEGRPSDVALFVGSSRSQIIMQETLSREGVGKTRMFDANAKSGKNRRPLSKAERHAVTVAHSIDK